MSRALRRLVRDRADGRCEYCHVRQDADSFFTFHVEHVRPRQHGGATDESNLALACHHCNLHKGPNLTAVDPETGAVVPLFNPRAQRWDEHFAEQGGRVQGKDATGRATVTLMVMNAAARVHLRAGGAPGKG